MEFVFETTCKSLTGYFLYSDTYSKIPPREKLQKPIERQVPLLSRWAAIPVIGILAGITRIALAKIHIVGHLLAAALFWDKGHLMHALKGAVEGVRGVIESTWVVGRIFVWLYDAPHLYRFDAYCRFQNNHAPIFCYSVFLIRICHPKSTDPIDLEIQDRQEYVFL